MWAAGTKRESLEFLRQFTASLSRDLDAETDNNQPVPKQKMDELSRLLARCFYKQGEWQMAMKEDWGSVSNSLVLSNALVYICLSAKRQGYLALIYARYPLRPSMVQSLAHLGIGQLRSG